MTQTISLLACVQHETELHTIVTDKSQLDFSPLNPPDSIHVECSDIAMNRTYYYVRTEVHDKTGNVIFYRYTSLGGVFHLHVLND